MAAGIAQETTSVRCEQSSGDTENSSMHQWRHAKGVEKPADIVTRGMTIEGLNESVWLNGPVWLQADEEKWPKPWRQVNEVEAEHATSTVATENKLDQLLTGDDAVASTELNNSLPIA